MNTMIECATMDTPLGPFRITATQRGIRTADFVADGSHGSPPEARADRERCSRAAAHLAAAVDQLEVYFDGGRELFDLPLDPIGTEFQLLVWRALCTIPHGRTSTYRDIAHRIGRPTATRAVGRANGANPIAIIVPCHRVIGVDGSLTGYAGGLALKRRLLDLEHHQLSMATDHAPRDAPAAPCPV